MSTKKSIGVGLLAAAAGAATTYYLYATKDGADKRAKIGKFTKKLKEKSEDKIDEISEAAGEAYDEVKELMKDKYDSLKDADKKEISGLAARIKGHWGEIKTDIKKTLG